MNSMFSRSETVSGIREKIIEIFNQNKSVLGRITPGQWEQVTGWIGSKQYQLGVRPAPGGYGTYIIGQFHPIG